MSVLTFEDAEAKTEEFDKVPPLDEVEHPCDRCGRETGWSGRGRRKKLCDTCKPKPASARSGPRVTGKTSDMAAQAAKVLSGANNMAALGAGAFGFHETMASMFDANEGFENAAYQALLTNPKLCQQILSAGEKSSGLALGLAYLQYTMAFAPALMMEYKKRRDARSVDMDG